MKLLLIFIILSSQLSWANELKLYVITPQFEINWSSPQTLAVTTALNSVKDDYAPIGHFAVEINCETPNRYGVQQVLTGMERKDKKESQRITLEKKLGLGSLIYSFQGALQSSETSTKEISLAARDKRLKIIRIPTTANRCQHMMSFLEDWIRWNSHTVYGGGKKTAEGEGAGCADFAMEFFKIATAQPVPLDWLVQIHVPYKLIGDGKEKKVPFKQILKTSKWGDTSTGLFYEIADTNKVDKWLSKNLKKKDGLYVYDRHLETTTSEAEYELPTMRYFYHSRINPHWLWNQIKLK
jgi:hypothetical protein